MSSANTRVACALGLFLALDAVLAAPAGAVSGIDEDAQPPLCELYADYVKDPKSVVWSLTEYYREPIQSLVKVARESPVKESKSDPVNIEIGRNPRTPAIPLQLDGSLPWQSTLHLRLKWTSLLPAGLDLIGTTLTVRGDFMLGGHIAGADVVKIPIQSGVGRLHADALGPTLQEATAHFTIFPETRAGVPTTLDAVRAVFTFSLNRPDPVATPGRLEILLDFTPPEQEEDATELIVPGACEDPSEPPRSPPPAGAPRAHDSNLPLELFNTWSAPVRLRVDMERSLAEPTPGLPGPRGPQPPARRVVGRFPDVLDASIIPPRSAVDSSRTRV